MAKSVLAAPAGRDTRGVPQHVRRRGDGAVLTKMDDDDHYAPNYVADQLHALSYSGADVVGKQAHYMHLRSSRTAILRAAPGSTGSPAGDGTNHHGPQGSLRGPPVSRLWTGARTQPSWRPSRRRIIYAADRFNYCQVRPGAGNGPGVPAGELAPDDEILIENPREFISLIGVTRPTHFRTIAVIGLGYIGLPTAAILATNGLEVIGVDVNPRTVNAVNNGDVPFVEPDLGVHVAGAVSQGRLGPSRDARRGCLHRGRSDAVHGGQDGRHVLHRCGRTRDRPAAARRRTGNPRVDVAPGGTRRLGELISRAAAGPQPGRPDGKPKILVAHCPERVLPGRIMIELVDQRPGGRRSHT